VGSGDSQRKERRKEKKERKERKRGDGPKAPVKAGKV
jgi:hypothetical protein